MIGFVFALVFTLLFGGARAAVCPKFSGKLRTIEHDVSGTIRVRDDCSIEISGFTYDGGAPQVYLWWGEDCSSQSISKGSRFSNDQVPEKRVFDSTFQATAKEDLDFSRIGCLSVYCEAFNANLADVRASFDVGAVNAAAGKSPPPSTSSTSQPPSPRDSSSPRPSPPPASPSPPLSSPAKSGLYGLGSCQVLKRDYLQVHWTLNQDQGTVKMALEGRPGPDDTWMAFGFSPPGSVGAQMVGASVIVAGYAGDECFAYDYLLSNREQCDFLNGEGVCPTVYSNNSGVADIPIPPLELECGRNGSYMTVLFERDLGSWPTDGADPSVWAMGPVSPGSDASRPVVLYHALALPGSGSDTPTPVNTPTGENLVVALDNRQNTCSDLSTLSDDVGSQASAVVPVIFNTTEFVVTSGPYSVHPDPPGWGLAYIVNNMSLPVINVVRGTTYRFRVMAGPTHPLYLTSSPFGAGVLSDFENEVVYAGGEESFGTDEEPFILEITPDASWPETLYYQCAVHQKLGWQVRVFDSLEDSMKDALPVDETLALDPSAQSESDIDTYTTFVPGGACELFVDGEKLTFQNCATVSDGRVPFNYAWTISVADGDPSSTVLKMGMNATLAPNEYISLAFPKDRDTMIGSTALVLSRDSSDVIRVSPYFLGGQTQDAVKPSSGDLELIDTSSSIDGDIATCTFTVSLPVPYNGGRRRSLRQSMSTTTSPTNALDRFNMIWASGTTNANGNPTYHGINKGSIEANLLSGQSSASENTQTINWSARTAHMWLMAIGWGLLIPSGIVAVRMKQSILSSSWFNVHRAAMTVGFLCGIGGIAAGFSVRGTWATPYSVHRDLGVSITVLGFVQILSIVARPGCESKVRPFWRSWHRVIGVSTVCLAIANVYYGMFHVAQLSAWAWGLYSGLLGAIAIIGVANELWVCSSHKYGAVKNAKSVTVGRDNM